MSRSAQPRREPAASDTRRLAAALARAEEQLLAARRPGAGWRGRLSTSALSTATAVVALLEVTTQVEGKGPPARPDLEGLAVRGLTWLADHPNPDGGWGDTPESASNLSTTTLVWAALEAGERTLGPGEPSRGAAIAGARGWIENRTGGLDPETLRPAIEGIYGDDRTFSIPILTHCALAGVLGPRDRAFRKILALPFELAALPQSLYRFVGLPVVSYALPALIAVGQVRHHHAPSRFPPLRWLRSGLRSATLRRLEAIQPSSGGYLEAIPLTSFVLMSLAGAGQVSHPVVERGLQFLSSSIRDDGSWPIDVDLATWLTTLSIQALTTGDREGLEARDAADLRELLLAQQYTERHPFTGAAPGGWAWTELPGGVPDADDTASALLALAALERLAPDPGPATRRAVSAGVDWLLDLQNRDGGLPTFCRGWGKLPFDRSAPDLTAHALRAFAAWGGDLAERQRRRVRRGADKALAYLEASRRPDGSWLPLWFGNEAVEGFENPTYGTARVLRALAPSREPGHDHRAERLAQGAVAWLLAAQGREGGWGGAPGCPPSVEETALAVEALAWWLDGVAGKGEPVERPREVRRAVAAGARFLAERIEAGALDRPAPIGFYFANLWYSEALYPPILAVGALRRAVRLAEAAAG